MFFMDFPIYPINFKTHHQYIYISFFSNLHIIDEVFKVKWPGPRTVFLDDIEVPRNNVVVGLGFKLHSHQESVEALRLIAYSVPMNFSAGVFTNETHEGHFSEESG